MPSGAGTRCYGFISEEGEWEHCTRPEYAGDIEINPKSETFPHRLTGDCRCGVRHDPAPPATLVAHRNGAAPKTKAVKHEELAKPTGPKLYYYPDAAGQILFRVRRYYVGGQKKFIQETPTGDGGEWEAGLNGVEPFLYRLPEIQRRGRDPLFVVEGEKDADRLASLGLFATTSPMGAGKWYAGYAAQLGDGPVYVLPDNDDPGRAHAAKIVETRRDAVVVELPGLGDKEDVSDWLDRSGDADTLRAIAEAAQGTQDRPARFEPADLAAAIERPPEKPEMLIEDLIYPGRVHGLYSGGGLGKSWLALWTIKKIIEQGKNVALIDHENGLRIVADRLRSMGVDSEVIRRHLIYVPFPSMPLSADATADFVSLLEEHDPALVVIDSWIACLAAAGLDENSAVDIAKWTEAYPQQARKRGIAVLILDHIPKEGGSARGSGRKLDYVDVMHELRNPLKFDRQTIGRIDLHLRKDREGWLPRGLMFRVGGGPDGFVLERCGGLFPSADEATGLLPIEQVALDALRSFGEQGATDKEWREEAMNRGLARSTYYKHKETLGGLTHVKKVADRFYCKTPAKAGSTEVHAESIRPDGPRLTEGGP